MQSESMRESLRYFNSIKVRLEPIQDATKEDGHLHFNSIKVRLEPLRASRQAAQSPQFQFHKGTIRTFLEQGSILSQLNFNSIKVRLELRITFVSVTFYGISIP